MKKLCIVTSTRAEYGILSHLIQELMRQPELDVRVVVTGTHLAAEFGHTIDEIRADGVPVDREIEMLLSSDTPAGIAKSGALAILGFSEYFAEEHFDGLLLLGDRYEILAVSYCAAHFRIPVFHIHGGESTFGAVDEAFRHAITKMSLLHFTTCEDYRRRVIQLGEDPTRVINAGSLGVENCKRVQRISLEKLSASLNFTLQEGNYAIVTFHPVTLENETSEYQVLQLLNALDHFTDRQFVFTLANADTGGRRINNLILDYVNSRENCTALPSLGYRRYFSALYYAWAVIGNSSSGVIEAPSFHIPTINIGDRQAGRIQADSILNCRAETQDILRTLELAGRSEFLQRAKEVKNPYEKENTSGAITKVILSFFQSPSTLKKRFFDLPSSN